MANQIPETKIDHLNFYLEHEISPVHQDISDILKHFERRGALYTLLGIPKRFMHNIDILEVGPGSGHNSLYVAANLPKTYDLLEPNPTAIKEIKELYNSISNPHTAPNVIAQRLEDFSPQKEYDIVISECWLGVASHERKMMQKLGTFLKPNGILITTLSSPIGALTNALRRVLANILTHDIDDLDDKTDVLLDAFSSHLETMPDMTRPFKDWVQDCMINPGFLTICPTPQMLIEDLGENFEIYNSYPRFCNDWRWYKSLYGENKCLNKQFMNSFASKQHNFFDYTALFPDREPEKNLKLEAFCFEMLSTIVDMEQNSHHDSIDEIKRITNNIQLNLVELSPKYFEPFEEFKYLLNRKINPNDVSNMKAFKTMFGRELLYTSAIKNNTEKH